MSSLSTLYIGVMTGTSLDGLDAVLADFSNESPRILASVSLDYPAQLRTEMLALQAGSHGLGLNELHRSQVAAIDLARLHGAAVRALLLKTQLQAAQIAAIGVHGQTVRHAPTHIPAYTVQLINASDLAESSRCTVVSDFRSRDIAASGQGAPLVPAFHASLCRQLAKPVAILNIGGFANVTLLQADGTVMGFDTGPGNVLMDAWAQQHTGQLYDACGDWAASGQLNDVLLNRLLTHAYFSQPLPKSTGREAFDLNWLAQHTQGLVIAPADVQATLTALTASTVAQAVLSQQADCQGVYVCGGGAYNTHLMSQLQNALHCPVFSTQTLGVAPQHMEALAFAWLARQCLLGLPGNVPQVTGALGGRILGQISPA